MATEITIPALPCGAIQDVLTFYIAMGFEITYQQTRPNTYASVKRGAIDLHFFTLKDYVPANSYSTCLVLVEDADALYQAFADGLRRQYGKLPVAGIPRITRPNNRNSAGDRRFNVIDPGGNWIRFIQQGDKKDESEVPDNLTTKLSRAVLAADWLVNSKGDFPAAAKMLDAALARDDQAVTAVQRVQALILRAEVALNMDDHSLGKRLLADASQIALSDSERDELTGELQRADELARMLQ